MQQTTQKTKKSLNLKKLCAVLAVPVVAFAGIAYYVLSDSGDDVGFTPPQRGQRLAPDKQGLSQTSLPTKTQGLPNAQKKEPLSLAKNDTAEQKKPASAQSTAVTPQSAAVSRQETQIDEKPKVPTTVELLTTGDVEVLVEDPFSTSAVSAAGEQIAAQQQILRKRTELAGQLASFLTQKVQIMELQQKLADAQAAKEAREAEEETQSASEKFLEDRATTPTPTSTAEPLDRFKVPEIATSNSSDVYEDIEEPEPIDVLGIISSSNTGSILILKDGRRLPLKVGSRLDENWKIQKVVVNEEKADITFETNDHSKTSMQTVTF